METLLPGSVTDPADSIAHAGHNAPVLRTLSLSRHQLFLHGASELTEFMYRAHVLVARECFLFEFDNTEKNKAGKL